jgi:gluconokinase
MGVAGVGKSTIGRALAAAIDWTFVDADDLHPPANVEKIARGEGLDDHDRAPWLVAIAARLEGSERVVLACSALKALYREQIAAAAPGAVYVHLVAPAEVIAERLVHRPAHFAGPAILATQLRDLEGTDDALIVDATAPVDEIVGRIVAAYRLGSEASGSV